MAVRVQRYLRQPAWAWYQDQVPAPRRAGFPCRDGKASHILFPKTLFHIACPGKAQPPDRPQRGPLPGHGKQIYKSCPGLSEIRLATREQLRGPGHRGRRSLQRTKPGPGRPRTHVPLRHAAFHRRVAGWAGARSSRYADERESARLRYARAIPLPEGRSKVSGVEPKFRPPYGAD